VGVSGWSDVQPTQNELFEPVGQTTYNPRLLKTIDAVAEKFGKGMLQVGPPRKTGK
jgi:hypothetical protein